MELKIQTNFSCISKQPELFVKDRTIRRKKSSCVCLFLNKKHGKIQAIFKPYSRFLFDLRFCKYEHETVKNCETKEAKTTAKIGITCVMNKVEYVSVREIVEDFETIRRVNIFNCA